MIFSQSMSTSMRHYFFLFFCTLFFTPACSLSAHAQDSITDFFYTASGSIEVSDKRLIRIIWGSRTLDEKKHFHNEAQSSQLRVTAQGSTYLFQESLCAGEALGVIYAETAEPLNRFRDVKVNLTYELRDGGCSYSGTTQRKTSTHTVLVPVGETVRHTETLKHDGDFVNFSVDLSFIEGQVIRDVLGPIYRTTGLRIFRESVEQDDDGDFLNDQWEEAALKAISPMLSHDEDEDLFYEGADNGDQLISFARVSPSDDMRFIVFQVVATYTKDYGGLGLERASGHWGDTQGVQLVWEVVSPYEIRNVLMHTSGHALQAQKNIYRGSELSTTYSGRPIVYVEEAKHGTWGNLDECNRKAGDRSAGITFDYSCGWDAPNSRIGEVIPPVVNVGEPPCSAGTPLLDYAPYFPGERIWLAAEGPDGKKKFCGGAIIGLTTLCQYLGMCSKFEACSDYIGLSMQDNVKQGRLNSAYGFIGESSTSKYYRATNNRADGNNLYQVYHYPKQNVEEYVVDLVDGATQRTLRRYTFKKPTNDFLLRRSLPLSTWIAEYNNFDMESPTSNVAIAFFDNQESWIPMYVYESRQWRRMDLNRIAGNVLAPAQVCAM